MRRTLAKPVTREGIGVHSGQLSRCTLHPAESHTGMVFTVGAVRLPAHFAHLSASQQRTVLTSADGETSVETIEHLLAACYGLGVDDVRIDLVGQEVPILDGSAAPWCAALLEAGLREQTGVRAPLRTQAPLQVIDGQRWARLEPGDGLTLDITVDFPDPGIGAQHLKWALTGQSFLEEIAPARTFGLFRDLDRLRAAGLGLGASLDNTVAYDQGRVLNPEGLRFPDEPVRHKALDVLGDLALLGAPLEGRLTMMRPGHALTGALMGQILAMTGA